MKKFTIKDSHSIAASILSFVLAFISISSFKLTVWWHYIVGIIVVIFSYIIFYFIIELIADFYSKYIERANISSEFNEEINELDTIIDGMFSIKSKYDSALNEGYKIILIERLDNMNTKAMNKINFIKKFSESKSVKNKFNIHDFELCHEYEECCKEIANFLKKEKNDC